MSVFYLSDPVDRLVFHGATARLVIVMKSALLWRVILAWMMLSPADAEDLLYLVGRESPAEKWGIYWMLPDVPTRSPVKLIGGMGEPWQLQAYGDKLYWSMRHSVGLRCTDLLGKSLIRMEIPKSGRRLDDFLVYGERVYWIAQGRLGFTRFADGSEVHVSQEGLFKGLGIHEGRLYTFAWWDRQLLSMRLDGSDFRIEQRDLDSGRALRTAMAVSGDQLFAFVQPRGFGSTGIMGRGLESEQDLQPIESDAGLAMGLTASPSRLYWSDSKRVRRHHLDTGDTEFILDWGSWNWRDIAITRVDRRPVTLGEQGLRATGDPGQCYQLIHSTDLKTWTPHVWAESLFQGDGGLVWFTPQRPSTALNNRLEWPFYSFERTGFYSLFQYLPPEDLDTDDDGLNDGWEKSYFGDLTTDQQSDPDGDGLSNIEEYESLANPREDDTDDDGVTDREELEGPFITDLRHPDSDLDGISDGDEITLYGTAPDRSDTDGDRFRDGFELELGTDPLVGTSVPTREQVLEHYASVLQAHYDFESVDGNEIANRGVLGTPAILVGDAFRWIPSSSLCRSLLYRGESGSLNRGVTKRVPRSTVVRL